LGRNIARTYYYNFALVDALEELHRVTGEIAAAFAQNGMFMQFVATIPGRGFCEDRHSEGSKVSILPSACGKAYLANKTDRAVIDTARVAMRAQHTHFSRSCMQDLLDSIYLTRKQGFAVSSPGLHPEGMSAVAVSVRLPQSRTPIVIGVGNHKEGGEEQLARTMKKVLSTYRHH
jgi:DNA-binding IclR family transcriptional regulator